jgi:sugar O-acyltransferase (sialic acid O-acetyltransferase NeuD family)
VPNSLDGRSGLELEWADSSGRSRALSARMVQNDLNQVVRRLFVWKCRTVRATLSSWNMNKPDLVVYGAGGHGRVVVDTALAAGWTIQSWIDDQPAYSTQWDIPIITSHQIVWSTLISHAFVVAIGDNRIRAELFRELVGFGLQPALVIHPSAVISRFAEIGMGTVVAAGAVVNAAARIGENCIINTGCSVDHDCRVGPHCHISPGARLAGAVTIGTGTMVGTGAVLLPGIRIGEACVIGAGAVVPKELPPNVVAYGNPARIIRLADQA